MEPSTTAGTPPDTASRSAPRAPDLLPVAAIAALAALAYGNALGGAFVFDDVQLVRDDPALRDLGRVVGLEGLRLFPHRWVAFATFALNLRLLGSSPVGFHVVNVAIHAGAALLVFGMVRLAFRTPRLAGSALQPQARAVAFVAAALFVAHPIQTQAVTYIVQRMTSLATLLYLSAVVCWLRWRVAGAFRGWAGVIRLAAVVLLAVLAMKTKEIAFTLPFAILLAELAFFDSTRSDLLRLVPVLATAAIIPVSLLLAAPVPLGDALGAAGALTRIQTDMSRLDYLATQLAVVVTYLFLLLAPVGQNLDHDYPIHRSFLAPEVLSAALVLSALAGLGAWLWTRTRASARRPIDPAARLAAFGIAWWFLALSVESAVITIVDVINEHRVYLPSAGLLTAAAVGVALAARWRGDPRLAARRTAAIGAAVAVLLAAASFARNRVWATDVTLWSDAVQKSPGKSRPWLNLGTALREAGRPAAAAAALRRGVALDPSSSYGHSQLGAVLLSVGQVGDGEVELRTALALAPDDPEALFNLATLLWQRGRQDEARPLYARFAATAPASYERARGTARARAGEPAPAAPGAAGGDRDRGSR